MTISRRGVLLLGLGGTAAAIGGCDSGSPAAPDATATAPGAMAPTVGTSRPPVPIRAEEWHRLGGYLHGSVHLHGTTAYETARLVENPRYDGLRPMAVISVASAADIATTLAFAQDHAQSIAVRSGGHSYPGWSAGDPGRIVLDCRRLDQVSWHGANATVGAGAALAPVYAAVAARGQAIPGGSCATVGIGGLTLGGGVGVLTRALGLTCDSLTGMQIVTADGRIRHVDEQQDPDLFWALRGGGGGHLGVVTSFTFATAPAPRLQTFYLSWPISAATKVLEAWQSWAPSADPRLWSTLKALGGTSRPRGPTVLMAGIWTGTGAPDLSGLLGHCPRPTVHTSTARTYAEAMQAYAGCSRIPVSKCHTGPGGELERESFGATSHIGYRTLSDSGIGVLLDHVAEAQSSSLKEAGISMDLLGGRGGEVASDTTAFVHREALMTVQYTATFTGHRGGAADHYVHSFRNAMTPYWGNHAYVNYADTTLADPAQAYFGTNAPRLAQVRDTYDPHRFFNQPQGY